MRSVIEQAEGKKSSNAVHLHPILIKAAVVDMSNWTQDPYQHLAFSLCNFCKQSMSACNDFSEKSMRFPLHKAVRCFHAANHLLRHLCISTLMQREQRGA